MGFLSADSASVVSDEKTGGLRLVLQGPAPLGLVYSANPPIIHDTFEPGGRGGAAGMRDVPAEIVGSSGTTFYAELSSPEAGANGQDTVSYAINSNAALPGTLTGPVALNLNLSCPNNQVFACCLGRCKWDACPLHWEEHGGDRAYDTSCPSNAIGMVTGGSCWYDVTRCVACRDQELTEACNRKYPDVCQGNCQNGWVRMSPVGSTAGGCIRTIVLGF